MLSDCVERVRRTEFGQECAALAAERSLDQAFHPLNYKLRITAWRGSALCGPVVEYP